MALAEMTCAVTVEPEDFRQFGTCIGQYARVSGERGRRFRNRAHVDAVVIAAGQQRLPSRRAQRGRMKMVVYQPTPR